MPLTLFCHSISYDEFTCHQRITYVLFAMACEEALKRRNINIYCLLFWDMINTYKQTESKCYLLSVIDPMKFVETLFQIIVCHKLSVVHWAMSNKLYKHQCCLLSLSRSDVVWSSVVLLSPCPWETELISLLTMIDPLTCYWLYDVSWDHLPKIKIESCHSLPVDLVTRLLPSQMEALLTNCCHQKIYQIYAKSPLTHWYQYH